jgi:hypothetical protein
MPNASLTPSAFSNLGARVHFQDESMVDDMAYVEKKYGEEDIVSYTISGLDLK